MGAAAKRAISFNWSEYAAEACGTGFNVFVGLSAGVVSFSPDFPIASGLFFWLRLA
jgi:hypothetical protein